MTKPLPLGLLLGLCAGLLAACAALPQTATPTYTFLPTASRTALPSATATLPLRTVTATRQPATPTPVTPTESHRPATITTLPPWTPPAYTPPTAGPLALSPENARQIEVVTAFGHGRATDVAWSPDGKLLAVAVLNRVDVYAADTWALAATYPLPAEELAFDPAGGQLVASSGSTLRWLDLASGTLSRTAPTTIKAIGEIAFSPGGRWLAVFGNNCPGCGEYEYGLEVFEAASGASRFHRGETVGYADFAFSPDGSTLALATSQGLVTLAAATGAELTRSDTRSEAVAFLPEATTLLVLTETGLQTYVPATGQWALLPGWPRLSNFVLSADGRALFTKELVRTEAGAAWQASVWDFAEQKRLKTWPFSISTANVAFSPAGRWLGLAGPEAGVQLIELAAPNTPLELDYLPDFAAVTFGPAAPDGSPTVLAGGRVGGVWQWDLSGALLNHFPVPTPSGLPELSYYDGTLEDLVSLDYAASADALVASYAVGETQVRDFRTGQLRLSVGCADPEPPPPQINRAGAEMVAACGSAKHRLQRWDLNTASLLAYGQFPSEGVVEWRNVWLAAVSDNLGLTLRPLDWSSAVFSLPYSGGRVPFVIYALSASFDGRWLAATFEESKIIRWDLSGVVSPQLLVGHADYYGQAATDGVTALAFSPNTSLLASAGTDGTVRLWDPATGAELRRFEVGTGFVTDVAFSADGRYLAASSEDGLVRVWGLPNND